MCMCMPCKGFAPTQPVEVAHNTTTSYIVACKAPRRHGNFGACMVWVCDGCSLSLPVRSCRNEIVQTQLPIHAMASWRCWFGKSIEAPSLLCGWRPLQFGCLSVGVIRSDFRACPLRYLLAVLACGNCLWYLFKAISANCAVVCQVNCCSKHNPLLYTSPLLEEEGVTRGAHCSQALWPVVKLTVGHHCLYRK